MLRPSEFLKQPFRNSNISTRISGSGHFLFKEYIDYRKNQSGISFRKNSAVFDDEYFKSKISVILTKYYISKLYQIEKADVSLTIKKHESDQLPDLPADDTKLVQFTSELLERSDFELTNNNKNTKIELLDSLIGSVDDGEIVKYKIIHDIAYNNTFDLNDFDKIGNLRNVELLICFLYIYNPYGLKKINNINQVFDILGNFRGIDHDWELILALINSNNSAFILDNFYKRCNYDIIENNFYISKIVGFLAKANSCYNNYDLVGLLKVFEYAELCGFETFNSKTQHNISLRLRAFNYKTVIVSSLLDDFKIMKDEELLKYNVREQLSKVKHSYVAEGLNESVSNFLPKKIKRYITMLDENVSVN